MRSVWSLLAVVVIVASLPAGLPLLEPTDDSVEDIRQTIVPSIESVVDAYNEIAGTNHYASCNMTDNQYVGVVPKGEEQFEEDLEAMGFERNPVSCLKEQETTGEIEDGSFRLVDGDYQLHVVIYDRDEPDRTYVYAHYEYRWDRHPIKHYREDEFQHGKGNVREIMDEHGVEYDESVGHPKDL